ncbi:MAG: maltose alpha-D-glucosyltransferase [Candidatus Omnitrophica bacterium]|nr:maltose alpha-D-glucosyltransferase [Candidatus Omnitrophota bacterium]
MPFYPSPLKDDGYDISDYYALHPKYGTLGDFKVFLREAHRCGLRVITELVLNHTSDQHPWFQRSRRAKPGSRWRNFYVWSDTSEKYKDTRIIFKDVETSNWTWDPVANAYYWHRFFFHQPDLNYDNPEVHEEMFKAVDFWFELGVDGLRLDAVPYLYEREGTSCENLPETHAFLKAVRRHVDERFSDRMLLAEANQWPEDAVAYFGQSRGDECHMAFHFPLMPRLFMALRMEDRMPIVDILEQTPSIPEVCQWALFLRNHDELTLEMVTDEERDYMYRMYAHVHQARLNLGIRRRLAPLLGNDRKRIELLNALLLSLPGTPVLYYGDEIGMGENIYLGDRNGVRTPMQWSSDKNAGFSRANPQSLYLPIILDPEYHYEAVNVETQLSNPHSLLWWMRRLLALRKRWRALGEGKCEFLEPANRKILSYILRFQEETILVVANLSRFVQPVALDLTAFQQSIPIELFGRTEFPVITAQPYLLTLGPHGFFWFSLEPKAHLARAQAPCGAVGVWPALTVANHWHDILEEKSKNRLETVLADYLRCQRWFGGKAKTIKLITLRDFIPVPLNGDETFLTLLQVDYVQGDSETYQLPMTWASGAEADRLRQENPRLVIADLTVTDENQIGVLYDAIGNRAWCKALLDLIAHRRRLNGSKGVIESVRTPTLRHLLGDAPLPEPVMGKAEQSNTSVLYGEKFILKLFRRLEPGVNPDLEIGRFLTAKEFSHIPPVAGALEYVFESDERTTLAVLNQFIPGSKDAWGYTLDAISRYYDRVITFVAKDQPVALPEPNLLKLMRSEIPASVVETIGTYLESVRLLGVRTAELHLALASEAENKEFIPEPFTPHYQRGLYQSMSSHAAQNLELLRQQLGSVPSEVRPLAQRIADLEPEIIKRFHPLIERRINAKRIRVHGDFHLGQVLYTGKDFIIVDFEGEPAISLSQRRIKRSPLRDVAGMVRSFHYAAYAGLYQHVERGNIPPENLPKFAAWVRFWNLWVSVAYLKAYFDKLEPSGLLPRLEDDLQVVLQVYLLQKVLYELGYELNNRPQWIRIPLQGIAYFLGVEAG